MNMRGIDLNLLPILHALIDEAHVSRAATRLGMSQPAVSSALDRCRHLLGDPLLRRVGNTMQLTPKAEALRAPLAQAMQDLGALMGVGPPPLSELRQSVHIVMADALGTAFGQALRAAVQERAPGIGLILHPWSGGEVALDALSRGTADLALSVLPGARPDAIVARRVRDERYRVAMRAGHPAAGQFDLDRWLGWPHILVSATGAQRTPVDDALEALGRTRQVGMVVPSFLMVPDLLRGSDMIALLPGTMLAGRGAGGLHSCDPPVPVQGFTLHLAWHARRDQDTAVRFVAEQMERLLGNQG